MSLGSMKLLALSASFLTLSAQANEQSIFSESVTIGSSQVKTSAKLDARGLKSISIQFGAELLDQLPDEGGELSIILPLPRGVDLRPLDHISFDWNPHGHEPPGVYDLPHFDIHYYFISQQERSLISCSGSDLPNCEAHPNTEYIPENYIPTPGGVPQMGSHWVDPRGPEFNGERFTSTFIYGFYKGEMVFFEPMVTAEYLRSRPQLTKEIPQALQYAKAGHYPQQYRIEWRAISDDYIITLEDMRFHQKDERINWQ